MSEPDPVADAARAVRSQLDRLLPADQAAAAATELDAVLRRTDRGEATGPDLLAVLRRREPTRVAALSLLRGERAAAYRPLLGAALDVGGRYVCPRISCPETGDRLDDSEPVPRCPVHGVTMLRA
ncbi:hypothetical protein [Actinoplanes palleronii]|uniref:Uncharacterized protein n=1 Tax=Actinoplanes palleronii TaxID=113570 RepID=A0ABQ4BHN6_9ACTN|nr:hypothetical protein [Actinoplanes palleronii]GIE70201.1 hypothetical protein Apa02nite_063090 [Actinoplanes palleronii]